VGVTPKEIRNWRLELGWKDEDPRLELLVKIEIAAQLAEIAEALRTPPIPEKRSRYEGI
jgi:hypothetical protein